MKSNSSIDIVAGRKLGCFMATTLKLFSAEESWLHGIYGGLIDISPHSLHKGADYGTLTEMYLEQVLGANSRNIWWDEMWLGGPNDLFSATMGRTTVPIGIALKSVLFRSDLYPASLGMSDQIHVFILQREPDGALHIVDPQVGSIHNGLVLPLFSNNVRRLIDFPCHAYFFDWDAVRLQALNLGSFELAQRKAAYASMVLNLHVQIIEEKIARLLESIAVGGCGAALRENLFHPIMTSRQVALDDADLWDPGLRELTFGQLKICAGALYNLHLKLALQTFSKRASTQGVDFEKELKSLIQAETELMQLLTKSFDGWRVKYGTEL